MEFISAGFKGGPGPGSPTMFMCLAQLCPTQMAYWAKNYVTVLARAAHWMTYYWGPHIEWLILILAS